MLQIGQYNQLQVLQNSDEGVCFDDGRDGEVWLAERESIQAKAGEFLEVFVYPDSTDRLIATTRHPFAVLGEFTCLEVTSIQKVGAFLDWGLSKELFLPYREQTRELSIGDRVCVFIYLDNSDRIAASMRIEKHVERIPDAYEDGERVDLFVFATTDLGFKAVINGRNMGMLYKDEVFQPLRPGQYVSGYIKNIRIDGKIDLSLQQAGYKDCDEIAESILTLLEERGGHLEVGDKSSAETIYDLFGVSKKKFKMAVGSLYKKKLISIDGSANGIRLN